MAGPIVRKIVSQAKFVSNSDGTTREHVLRPQDWGLQVDEVVCAIYVYSKSANAKVGLRIDDGPTADQFPFATHSTPIALAEPTNTPGVMRGQTTADAALLPFFIPVLLVGGEGAATHEVTVDVYVCGKPS